MVEGHPGLAEDLEEPNRYGEAAISLAEPRRISYPGPSQASPSDARSNAKSCTTCHAAPNEQPARRAASATLRSGASIEHRPHVGPSAFRYLSTHKVVVILHLDLDPLAPQGLARPPPSPLEHGVDGRPLTPPRPRSRSRGNKRHQIASRITSDHQAITPQNITERCRQGAIVEPSAAHKGRPGRPS